MTNLKQHQHIARNDPKGTVCIKLTNEWNVNHGYVENEHLEYFSF